MSTNEHISEADLHGYVDGQLDAAARARVIDVLAADAALAVQVAGWERQNEALRAAYGTVAVEAIPARLSARATQRWWPRWRMRASQIAASLVLLGIGATAGWYGHERLAASQDITLAKASDLVANALAAHRVYTVEVRHPVEVTASEEDHLVKWLSKRLGAPLVAPDLKSQGFSLVGGRLLPDGVGMAAAQFMYENAQGQRITLYLMGNPDHRDTSFRMADSDGVNVFYWLDGPLGIAIAGPLERDVLMALVRIAYDQIDRRLEAG